jgi:hypothetical protein
MTTVTKESLAERIAELEAGPRSIKEDYQLEAYRMLLSRLVEEAEFDAALDEFEREE